MHFTCRSFIGNSESKSWSRFWENEPDDPLLKSTKGHLFALINLSSNEDKDLNSIGHDINFEFNQNYFNPDNSLDVLSNLDQSLNSIIQNPLYKEYKIDFIAAIVLKNQLFLISYGDCKAILKRQEKISILLNSSENIVDTLSGPIENNDQIFLLTNTFFEKISWQKIKQFLSDPKIQNIEENFLSAIYSLDEQKNLGAALIEIEADENEVFLNETDGELPPIDQPQSNFSLPKINQFFNHQKSVFVAHHEIGQIDKRKKISLVVGAILIIALVCSLFLGYQKTQKNKIEDQYQTLKNELQQQITNIDKIKSSDINQAKDLATKAQDILNQMSALKLHQDEIENYSSQINNILSKTGSAQNFTPDLFYDASQISSKSVFQKIIFTNNKIYLLDSQNGQIYSLDINTKSSKSIINSDKIKSAINLTFEKNNLYLINKDYVSLVENETITPKIYFADSDIVPTDLKFWNGAAYILDSTNQSILKYNPNSTGFSKPQSWLKNENKLDSNAISIAIDSKVWVLYQNGTVSPFLSGVNSDFKPSQTATFTQADNLTIGIDKDILVFTDNQNIVYIYQKTGELLSKYNLGNLTVLSLSLNESSNSIYLLCSDQKIYSIKF